MNEQLRTIYEAALARLSYIRTSHYGLSCPLFLYVPEAYHQGPIKLMVVGQQTYGWGDKMWIQ